MPPGSAATLRTLGRRAILCLLLGAILQYAVAAAFSLDDSMGKPQHGWSLRDAESGRVSGLSVIEHPAAGRDVLLCLFSTDSNTLRERASKSIWRYWGRAGRGGSQSAQPRPDETMPVELPAWTRFGAIRTDPAFDYYPTASPQVVVLEVGSGWPRRSASYVAQVTRPTFRMRDGIVLSDAGTILTTTPRVIPLHIIWPGAIINTVTYAAALFVPLTLFPWTRQHLRRRAGRCITCSYDLCGADHEVCPECGTAIMNPQGCTIP